MRRPADPDLLWLYYAERRDHQETLALLVDRAAALTRKAQAEGRGPHQLKAVEREEIDGLLTRASRLAAKLRGGE